MAIAVIKRGTARRLGLRPPTPRPTYRFYAGTVELGLVNEQELRRQLELAVANGRPQVIS